MRRLFHRHRNEEVAGLGKMSDAGLRTNPEVSTLDGIGKPRLHEAACAAPSAKRTRRFDAAHTSVTGSACQGGVGISTAPREHPDAIEGALPLGHLRRTLDDLLVPRPLSYWLDFLASITCFYAGFAASVVLPLGNPFEPLAAVAAVLAIYRSVVFIHELAHLPRDRLPGFRVAWNLLCGIPLLVPSFLYSSHLDHHLRRAYGTEKD